MQERSDVPNDHASMLLLGEGSEATEPYNKYDKIRPHSIRSLQFDPKVRPLSFRPEKFDLFTPTRPSVKVPLSKDFCQSKCVDASCELPKVHLRCKGYLFLALKRAFLLSVVIKTIGVETIVQLSETNIFLTIQNVPIYRFPQSPSIIKLKITQQLDR